jgi:hypothetical protein
VGGAHPAGCDPFARKRPEKLTKAQKYRLNIPALGLRRVVSSGYLSPPLPLAADDKTHQQQPLKCHAFRVYFIILFVALLGYLSLFLGFIAHYRGENGRKFVKVPSNKKQIGTN